MPVPRAQAECADAGLAALGRGAGVAVRGARRPDVGGGPLVGVRARCRPWARGRCRCRSRGVRGRTSGAGCRPRSARRKSKGSTWPVWESQILRSTPFFARASHHGPTCLHADVEVLHAVDEEDAGLDLARGLARSRARSTAGSSRRCAGRRRRACCWTARALGAGVGAVHVVGQPVGAGVVERGALAGSSSRTRRRWR